jgi:hypothetical protein
MNDDFESLKQRKIESLMEAQKMKPQPSDNNEEQISSSKELSDKLFELCKQYEDEVENFKKSFGPLCEQEWNTLSEEQRIKIWYYVCNQIYVNEFVDKGSYRHLIYTLFNFGPEAYSLGMDCGLMDIHNSITTTEDLSDNAMKASEYGIKNLKRIVEKLPEWTNEEADRFENLAQMYNQAVGQFNRYIGHVTRNVGGYYETPKSVEQEGNVFEVVPRSMQKEAVAFLNKQLFETPSWMIDGKILDKISSPNADQLGTIQDNTLGNLLSTTRLTRLSISANRFKNTYTIDELFNDLKNGIWSELSSKKKIDGYRRALQKSYVERMISLLSGSSNAISISFGSGGGMMGPDPKKSDIISIVKAHLNTLKTEINAATGSMPDNMSKYHLLDMSDRIKKALDPK